MIVAVLDRSSEWCSWFSDTEEYQPPDTVELNQPRTTVEFETVTGPTRGVSRQH